MGSSILLMLPCSLLIQRTQAGFFLKIITELRVEDEYFMVGYYGKGSPLFLRVCVVNVCIYNVHVCITVAIFFGLFL